MTAEEFRDLGYLQEVNRQFLHPLGLALEVVIEEDGTTRFGEVWDCRDDAGGIVFDAGAINRQKARAVDAETTARYADRVEAVGSWIQLLPLSEV